MKSTAPYYVLALALAIPAVLIGVEIPRWVFLGSPTLATQSDFRVLYTAGYMLRTHQTSKLYDFPSVRRNQIETVAADNGAVPFLHPALESVLFVPFSYLPYEAAYLSWAAVNLAILGCIYVLLRPRLRSFTALGPQWIVPGLLIGFMPVAFVIFAGQDSLLLVLVLVLAFRRVHAHEFNAGILMGLGCFRFQVFIPILLLFLLWRNIRIVAGWVSSASLVFGISALMTGIGAERQYFELLEKMLGVSFSELLRRMPNLRGFLLAQDIGKVPLLLLSSIIFLLVFAKGKRENSEKRLLLAISTSCLLTPYMFLHDLSMLALPVLLTMDEAVETQRWIRLVMLSGVMILFSALWFMPDHFYFGALFTSALLCLQLAPDAEIFGEAAA